MPRLHEAPLTSAERRAALQVAGPSIKVRFIDDPASVRRLLWLDGRFAGRVQGVAR